jgi:hypothetical protein
MMNIPTPMPINPRKPEMILPSHIGDVLVLPFPSAASRNPSHVTAVYKKIAPTTQQASAAAQTKNRVFPPGECAPGMTTIKTVTNGRKYGDSLMVRQNQL